MYFAIAGSSGCGKSTIINILIEENEKLKFIPSFTSRTPRPGEIEGKTYNYITTEEFQKKIANKEMLEFQIVHENYYGNSKKIVEDTLKEGKYIIKDVDVKGVQNLQEKLKDICPLIKVFFCVPKRVLKKRIIDRSNEGLQKILTENADKSQLELKQIQQTFIEKNKRELKTRMKRYKMEHQYQNKFDYVLVNGNQDKERTLTLTRKIIEIGDDYSQILPTKPTIKLSLKKIAKYVEDLTLHKDKIFSPCKIALLNDKIYLISGHEKFIASMITGTTVAKKFIDVTDVNILPEEEYKAFISLYQPENIQEENQEKEALKQVENELKQEENNEIEKVEETKKVEEIEIK